jgi:hypothetical protein
VIKQQTGNHEGPRAAASTKFDGYGTVADHGKPVLEAPCRALDLEVELHPTTPRFNERYLFRDTKYRLNIGVVHHHNKFVE